MNLNNQEATSSHSNPSENSSPSEVPSSANLTVDPTAADNHFMNTQMKLLNTPADDVPADILCEYIAIMESFASSKPQPSCSGTDEPQPSCSGTDEPQPSCSGIGQESFEDITSHIIPSSSSNNICESTFKGKKTANSSLIKNRKYTEVYK